MNAEQEQSESTSFVKNECSENSETVNERGFEGRVEVEVLVRTLSALVAACIPHMFISDNQFDINMLTGAEFIVLPKCP